MRNSIIIFLLIGIFASACVESEVCSTETTAVLNFEIRNTASDVIPDSIKVGMINRDTIFYFYEALKPTTGYLLLNPFVDTASFFVSIKDLFQKNIYDTILFQTAVDSNYKIVDTVTYSPDTLVTFLADIDSTFYNYYDVFTLYYKRTNEFLNDACGFTFEFNLDSINQSTNYIDSIIIDNKYVLLDDSENHLSIYIHTSADSK